MKRLTGQWLSKNLLVLVQAQNGDKKIIVMGKVSPKLKRKMNEYGFEWIPESQRWERKIRKTAKLPDFLKKKEE